MHDLFEPMEPAWDGMNPGADGGKVLRALRIDRGKTLMNIEALLQDAGHSIDASHLQRIESGEIKRPQRATIDAILTAGLNAPFRRRRDVLAAYGYRLDWALPTAAEVEEGRRICEHEMVSATWPAYLNDHGHRLWHWNRYVPRLLGLPPDDPAPSRFVGLTTLELVFDPTLGVNLLIANPDTYRPLFLHMFKVQTQPHAHEPWFRELIERAHGWPGFTEIWRSLPDDPVDILRGQPIFPIAFVVPGVAQPLRFRLALIYLALDPRFQVVHWIPFGAATMTVCAGWAAEDGVD